jgi:cyclopropane fatty-acyl-phospholipid synthase-like methyltransferase
VAAISGRKALEKGGSNSVHLSLAKRFFQAALTSENAFYESWLRISTRGNYGFTPGDWSAEEHIYYGPTPYRTILQTLDSLRLSRSDIVVDLGCGKGRVLCCASRYDVRAVIGVEDTAELCEIAELNLRRMRGRIAPWKIVRGKAEDYDYADGTVFYMFHAFGPRTLGIMLDRLKTGLRSNPRSVRIVYVNPKHEKVLEGADWLERYENWSAKASGIQSVLHTVSFWRVRPAEADPAR